MIHVIKVFWDQIQVQHFTDHKTKTLTYVWWISKQPVVERCNFHIRVMFWSYRTFFNAFM